jgi:hypothetical protein
VDDRDATPGTHPCPRRIISHRSRQDGQPKAHRWIEAKATASLVFSSAGISDGEEYTVYTGGTATVSAGIGEGSLDGATEQGTATGGEYTAAQGPGGGGGGPRW